MNICFQKRNLPKEKLWGMIPTGTKRRLRSDLICLKYINCEHRCPECKKKFTHRVEWGANIFDWEWQQPCHYYFVNAGVQCSKCLEYPSWDKGTSEKVKEMNNLDILKHAVRDMVVEMQGCKITELIPVFMKKHHQLVGIYDLIEVINSMIDDGDLVSIDYVLPSMNYRIKSFILPAGTKIE